MKVSLVGITKPEDPNLNVDSFLAFVARVSNPANQNNTETAPKLIKYLLKNKHVSPFEMVHIVMEIETTRDIGRQILRHRSFSFQEFSQRYAVATEFITNREARLQDKKNRQNSIETDDETLQDWFNAAQEDIVYQAGKYYNKALEYGIAKEQARALLPEGLTMTKMYMAGTLRSWIHYYLGRRKEVGTQKEHAEVAASCWNIICERFPTLQEINWEQE